MQFPGGCIADTINGGITIEATSRFPRLPEIQFNWSDMVTNNPNLSVQTVGSWPATWTVIIEEAARQVARGACAVGWVVVARA